MKYVSSCNSYVHYNSISDVVHYYISEPRLSKWPMHAIKYARVKDAFEVQGRPMDFKVTVCEAHWSFKCRIVINP